VAVNFGDEPFVLPATWGAVLLRSDGSDGGPLEASTGAWLARA
jgi:hypothetical protein